MRLTFSTVLLLCAQLLVGQIASFPHTQNFESVFTTGTNVAFIANWQGNEVATSNRIFQGTDARSGTQSLNVIPTSSFSGEILISLDMSSLLGGKIDFYAFSKENGVTSTRPALLYFSTSIDGGNNYLDNVQIGDESTFPNNSSTSYAAYEYEMPSQVAGQSNVIVKIDVSRGDGSGSVAEFVMDDFTITEVLPTLAINSLTYLDDDEIQIQFNQDVENTSAEDESNYTLDFGFGNPATAVQSGTDPSLVTLTFAKSFVNNTYELTIDDVENIDASSVASGLTASSKYETQTLSRQIVINEIFADPTGTNAPSPVILPTGTTDEFIELYNTTAEAIEITDFEISGGTIGDFTIPANDYVILTSTSNLATYQAFGSAVAVSSWNTLSNAGEQILLYDQLGNLIDSLSFDTSWYKDTDKADGGWTLEQINPELACSGPNNWSASNSSNGGTPSSQNSIYDNSPDTTGPTLDSVIINSPTNITLVFNELMDAGSLNAGSYALSDGVSINSAASRASGYAVDLTLNPSMTSGTEYTLTISGVTDCSGNANTQATIDFLFDNEPPAFERFIFKSPQLIDIVFDEPVGETQAEIESNYSINNSIGSPTSAVLNATNDRRVSLTLNSALTEGESFQLTIQNLEDSLGNTIVTDLQNFTFQDQLDTVIVISSQLLDVYFDEDLNASATTLSYYDVEGIGNPVSASIDGVDPKLIHLAFSANFSENAPIEIRFEDIQNSGGAFLQAFNTDFIYDTDDPDLIDFEVVDANNLQLNFDEILDQSTSEVINNYSANNGLGIPNTATLSADGTSVTLFYSSGFEQEVENQLTYTAIEDPSGNAITTNRTFNYTYDTRPPRFDSLIVLSPRELLLSFTEEVVESIAEDPSNYSVNNGIGNPNTAIRQDSATHQVLLTFTTLGNNSNNILTISNQRDLFSNDLSADIEVAFDNVVPAFGSFSILSDTSIQIQFTKELTTESAEDVENYGFDNGLGADYIEQDNDDASLVSIFLTKRLKEDVDYRLVVDSLEDVFGNTVPPTVYDFTFDTYLQSIEILSSNVLRLNFSKELSESLAESLTNYEVNNGIGTPISAVLNPSNNTQVSLTFGSNFTESTTYNLFIKNLADPFGGTIPASNNTVVYDVTPPLVTSINSIYENEIEVVFNEVLDPTTALALNHYNLDGGVGQPINAVFSSSDQNAVSLTFPVNLVNGQSYTLTLDRVEDTQGKAMALSNEVFIFESIAEPSFREIVVNEVYFDVDASSGLAPYEYVEIYNNAGEDFQLRDFQLTDGNDTAVFKNQIIVSGEYVVLSNGTGANAFGGTALSNFPSLSNNGETIYLLDRNDQIIDSLAFDKTLFKDESKEDGGYSIELINPDKPCFDPSNYAASNDANGGTPGSQNSIFDNSADLTAPTVIELNIINNTTLQVQFSEAMDNGSLLASNFSIQAGTPIDNISVDDDFGQIVTINLASEFERGSTQRLVITGVQDCSGNTLNTQVDFELGALPQVNELLITEIMATPSPTVGLPNLEYVEVYNNSSNVISLNDVYLADNAGRTQIGDININPASYLILTKNSSTASFDSFGDVQGINSFPTFTTQDEARLENADSSIIFSVSYDRSFFKDDSKDDGGYSLEMIRLNPACQSPDNWTASINASGGTPGQQNSVFTASGDSQNPTVLSFEVLSDTTFAIEFSKAMDISTLVQSNFIFSPSLNVNAIHINDAYGYSITVELDAAFPLGTLYNLSFQNLADCAGNALSNTSFDFAEGRMPNAYELIITELMAKPSPSIGLPESEYVEIYNSTSDILSLENVVLADLVNSTVLPDTIIGPNEYLLLVPNSLADQFTNAIALFNWPNLNDDRETIKLYNSNSEELFRVSYTDSWYRSTLKSQGGYSLEMIDLDYPCVEENNWTASESATGGTPAALNSVNGNNPDNQGPELMSAIMLDAGSIQLTFSERLNSNGIQTSDFQIDNGSSFIAHSVDETEKIITLYTATDLVDNLVYTIEADNLTDCTGNLIDANNNSATLIVPGEAIEGDVVVNEVLFNPRPGSSRFIEFYNNSGKYINLKDWRVSGLNNNRIISEEDYFIAPNSFFVITDDAIDILAQYPASQTETFIEIGSMPSMRDDSGAAILLNSDGLEIDAFNYSEDFHSPLLSDDEGVSLERIVFTGESNDENNWFSASSSDNYATPGYANSQARPGGIVGQAMSIEPKTFSPDVSGAAPFTTINFNFDNPGNVLNVTIYDASGNLVKRVSENKLIGTQSFFTWDGTREDGTRARIGYYMILTEVINAEGQVQYLKDKVAIGGRF